MSEKITYGISNVHYASKTEDAEGAPIYGAPMGWEGADELALPPVGEPVVVYADDVEYYRLPVNQGYDGNINVRQVPENFKTSHLGEYKDANGVLIEKDGITPDDFALLGEFKTADSSGTAGKRFALYNCSAGRPDLTAKTKEETVDPVLFSVPIRANPTKSDLIIKATIKKADNEPLYTSWFNSVYYEPDAASNYIVTVKAETGVGAAIKGAVVVVGQKMALTDAEGKARFAVPAGTYDVLISASGYTADTDSVTVTNENVVKTITMV